MEDVSTEVTATVQTSGLPAGFALPAAHPFLPVPTAEDLHALAQQPDGPERYAAWLREHNRLLAAAEERPLQFGFEPDAWNLADSQFSQGELVAVFGANRTTKSWWAAKRFCEAATTYPGGVLVALAEKDEASIATQQQWVWFYLKSQLERLNNKRHPVYKVNYTQANGFTDGKLVLPNRTEIYFLTYKTTATDYEGWEFGSKVKEWKTRKNGSRIENVGWWADESLTWAWLEVLTRRSPFRRSKGLWTFTPIRGITPTIKQFLGQPRILKEAPAELLPKARIEGCTVGHMPVVVQPAFHRPSRGVYFHIGSNPFGDYTQQVRELCEGKAEEYIERIAYGYARDAVGRAFPGFTGVNMLPVKDLPAIGTIYQYTDPHGTRPFASIWVLVSPGKLPSYYIIRNFPDEPTYGAWAIPTERETTEDTRKGWDGDPGPAQNPLGWGVVEYKRCWRDKERLPLLSSPVIEVEASAISEEQLTDRLRAVKYPWQRRQAELALRAGGIPEGGLHERVRMRYMDARFCNAERADSEGTTCLKMEFEKDQKDKNGLVTGARMAIEPASGKDIQHGMTLVTDLLAWDRSQPYMPHINAPRLYVSEEATQVIWALSNYTGRAGESGASKEWIDLLRHLAESAPVHVEPGPVGRGLWTGY